MSLKLAGPEWTPLVMPNYCPIDAQFAQYHAFFHLLRSLLIHLRYIHDAIDSFKIFLILPPTLIAGLLRVYCGFAQLECILSLYLFFRPESISVSYKDRKDQ